MVTAAQSGAREYFRAEPRAICFDVRTAGELASCCGVNLVFDGFVFAFGLGFGFGFSQVVSRAPFEKFEGWKPESPL